MRTKELFAAAEAYTDVNDTVSYLVTMIKSYEAQLGQAAAVMKDRMDILEKVIQGEDRYSYMMRSKNGDAGSEIDTIQGQIYELACMLQIVLENTYGIEMEE